MESEKGSGRSPGLQDWPVDNLEDEAAKTFDRGEEDYGVKMKIISKVFFDHLRGQHCHFDPIMAI